MSYYVDKERAGALVNLHLEAYRKAISLVPAIKEVVSKFNNKTFNKRLDTTLKAIDDSLSVSCEYNSFVIDLYIDNRSITSEPDEYGVCCATYLNEHKIRILWGNSHPSSYELEGCISENKINAEYINMLLDKAKTSMEKTIAETEIEMAGIADILKEKEELEKRIEEFNHKTNFLVDSYFKARIETKPRY